MGKGVALNVASNAVTFDFTGATVLVTGGSNGIGLGIATAFADAGAHVTITGTRTSPSEYDHDLSRFEFVQCSMADPENLATLAQRFTRLDVLVNNAGQVMPRGGNEYDPDVFDEALRINASAAFRLSRLLHRSMKSSDLRGGASIVNLASLSSFFAVEFVPGYGAAKASVVQMTKTLAVHYSRDNIRVNAVAPGVIESNMTAPMIAIESLADAQLVRIPQGRFGTPADVSPTVLFLASEQASYITGQTLLIDGGFSVLG